MMCTMVSLRTGSRRSDRLGLAPWAALGEEKATRLRELARPFAKQAVAAGAFPARRDPARRVKGRGHGGQRHVQRAA